MAKVTIIITDEGGVAMVEFIPEPNFDAGSDNLTMAQEAALIAMDAIEKEAVTEIADGPSTTLQ